ncbi:kinetochore-associated protein DSN1 homolog [Pelodytes ibericus]
MEMSCQKSLTSSPTKSSPGRTTNRTPRKRASLSPAVKSKASPSPAKKPKTSPHDLSLKDPLPSPRQRKSLRRSVRDSRRRTLPSIHNNAAELCKSIKSDLPERDRVSELLQRCFQFSMKKLEDSLKSAEDFNAEDFNEKVSSVTQKLKRFTERLSRDGTLKKFTEEPTSLETSPETEALKEQIREYITKFSDEGQSWDSLLKGYQQKAEELSRQLTENKLPEAPSASSSHLPTSQDNVLHSKPDYKGILSQQGAVFDCMEIVLDELQQSVHLLNSFLDDTTQHLQKMSSQLRSQSLKPVDDSPARKLLNIPHK